MAISKHMGAMNHKHILRTFTFTYIFSVYRNTHIQVPTDLPAYIHHTYIDYQPQSGLGFRPSTKNKLNCALNLCWWWRNSCCRKHKVLHSSMRGFDIPYWLPCGTWIATPPRPWLPWRTNVSWMRYLFTAIFTRSCLKQAAGSCLCGSSIPLMSTSTFHVFSMRTSARPNHAKGMAFVWLDIWVKTYMTIQLCCVWNFEIYSFFYVQHNLWHQRLRECRYTMELPPIFSFGPSCLATVLQAFEGWMLADG